MHEFLGVLCDFHSGFFPEPSQREIVEWHLSAVDDDGLAGWCVWQYKDDPGNPRIMDQREANINGAGADGWKQDVVEAIWAH